MDSNSLPHPGDKHDVAASQRSMSSLGSEPGQPADISLAVLWRTLNKHRWVILGSVVICVAMAATYCTVVKPRYTATAEIAINADNPGSLDLQNLGITTPGSGDTRGKLATEVWILRSDTLALDVIKKLNLENNPLFFGAKNSKDLQDPRVRGAVLGVWESGLSVKVVPQTDIVEISFRSKSPEIAASAVNTLVSAYIERNFRVKYESTMQASDWLSQQLNDVKEKTQESEQKLADYETKSGILFWGKDNSNSVVTDRLGALNQALTAAQADRIVKESRYRVALSGNPELLAKVAPASSLQVLHTQEADLRNQYAQATEKFGSAYPKVKQLKAQLAEVDVAINREVKNVTEQLKDEFESAKRAEDMLKQQMDAQTSDAYKLNQGAVQLQILRREAESNRDLYEGLLTKLKEAGVVAGLKSTNIDVVDYAAVPTGPSDPKVRLIVSLGFWGGLLLGVAGAFVLEGLDDTLSGMDEAELNTGLPSLAEIPMVSTRQNARRILKTGVESPSPVNLDQIALTHPKSQAAEAFRTLRTSILLSRAHNPPKTIVVTSTLPAEGKSTVSLNTAIVLAQKNARVLLIDADLRRGTLHKRLGLPAQRGLSAVLTGTATLEQSVACVEQLPNLCLLSGGEAPPNPAELLGSRAMQELLKQCSEEYEFVIIDTPPVLTVTDAVILASETDATILVIRYGQTSRRGVRHAHNLLLRSNAKVIGLVMNAVDPKSPDYYYSGGSRYGNYYSSYYENPTTPEQ